MLVLFLTGVLAGKLELFDLSTGQSKGSFDLTTGGYPLAVTRQSAGEVLLSSDLTLFVLDTNNGLAVKREIPLHGRLGYKVYEHSLMVISNNDRYLYYLTWNGYIGVLDMDSTDGKTNLISPGGDCQVPRLSAIGAEAVMITCARSGEVTVMDPSGKTVPQRHFTDLERGTYQDVPAQIRIAVPIAFSTVLPSGYLGSLLMDGRFKYQEAGGSLESAKVTSEARVALGQVYQLDKERLLVGYADYGNPYPKGLVVFNLSTMQVERDVKLGEDTLYLSHNGPSTAMILKAGGTIDIIDLNTGATRSVQTSIDTSVGHFVLALVP